ncbi:CynX/NimT family MFS transporter [Leuconostoc litchii]|uniref:CynX/NimT family MFS transporter n=1 Tax=Leuconostoc litchii TaxID=1981069 RepID=UPI0024E0B1DA|nr:MFS transporter [Leuconostoc litchii]
MYNNIKSHSKFLVPGIIVVGMVLRLPFTSIPPIMGTIARDLHVPVASLGTLTTIPLLSFAVFSVFAPRVAQKLGLERAFTFMLGLLIIGSFIRILNTPFLYIGTIFVGIAIAHMNVLLPSVIRTYFPNKVGFMTSVFTFSMMLATALGAALSAPITAVTGWHVFIILVTLLLILALFVWLPNYTFTKADQTTFKVRSVPTIKPNIWRNKYAWLLLIFSGLQSMMFYVQLAWGPTMVVQTGLSSATASMFAGLNSLIGLPFALLVPTIVARLNSKQRQWGVGIFSILGTLGYVLLLHPQGTFIYWLIVNLLIGIGTSALFPYLMTTFSLKTSSAEQTAQLSGMAQSGGYLLAATGPLIFGYAYSWFHSWLPQVIVLIVLFILMTVSILVVEKQDKILY